MSCVRQYLCALNNDKAGEPREEEREEGKKESEAENHGERAVISNKWDFQSNGFADNIEQLRISHVATIGIGNRQRWGTAWTHWTVDA